MKFVFTLAMLFFCIGAQAAFPVNCQMRMLKVATDAYETNWRNYTGLFSIEAVVFDFTGIEKAAVVFTGQPNYLTKVACTLRVEMTYPACEDCGGCPTYTLSGLKERNVPLNAKWIRRRH